MEKFDLRFNEDGFLQLTYLRESEKEEFEKVHYDLLELQEQSDIKHRLMVNPSAMGAISLELQEFVASVISPKLADTAGQKIKIALILGKDAFANFAAKSIAEKSNEHITSLYFANEEDAAEWLLQQ